MTGARFDETVIERRLAYMMDAVQVLEEYRDLSVEALTEDPKVFWAVQHGLQLCVQTVLDVSAYYVAALSAPVADSYRGNLLTLARLGVLPDEFAARIAPMSGFRNILVHQYIDVDGAEVHRVLDENLADFAEFARYIHAHLKRIAP